MPIHRNPERKFSISSASSLDRLGKNKFKRVRHPRNRFKKKCFVQRKHGSSEWVFMSQDGDKMSFEANSQITKNFQKIHTIGKGGFGTVVKVKHKIDNCFYAIKCILLNLMDTQRDKIMKEVRLLSPLDHDNIVRYFSTWIDDCTVDEAKATDDEIEGFSEAGSPALKVTSIESSDIVFQDDYNNNSSVSPSKSGLTQVLCIQMEFCKTTLADVINFSYLHKKQFRAWKIFWEIVHGLAYLNKKGVIHRDLKPQNIFLDKKDRVKIGDFGLATKIFRGSSTKEHIKNSLSAEIGTSFYRAPELNLVPEGTRVKYGQEIDIYSLGIILFEMFHPPFSTASERFHVLTNLRKKEIIMPNEFMEDEKNAELIHLIRLLLNHDASARPTCADLHSMEKSKQLTNSRKTYQKQIKKKENVNPIQQAYALPNVHEHCGNAKCDGNVNDDLKRYLRNKDKNQNFQQGIIITSSKEHFSNLLLKFEQEKTSEIACIAGPIEAVTLNEVKKAVLNTIGFGYRDWQISKIVKQLVKFFNSIISLNGKIPNVFQNGDEIEGDLTDSEISETIDIIARSWENVIARRITRLVRSKNPCQYTSGARTKGAINCLKLLVEKYRSLKKDVNLVFIRLEKDKVPPELIWTALRAEHVPEQYIDLMKNSTFDVPTGARRPTDFNTNNNQRPAVLQSSTLSPLLFNTVVNYVTEGLLQPAIWTLLYENNIVLASETVEELLNAFSSWCKRLESGGLNVIREETEFLCCNFSGVNRNIPPTIIDNIVLAGPLSSHYQIDTLVNKLLK